MAWPSWSPKAVPAMVRMMDPSAPICWAACSISAGMSRIWFSRVRARAAVTASATGAHTSFHTGRVRSTQVLRLQASRCPGAGMSSVAVSSHRSATWRAWRVESATAAVTVGSPSPRACRRARSWPICQLTGSEVEAENICWNWARMASN